MKLLGRIVGYHLTEGPNAGQCRPAVVVRVQSKDDAVVVDLSVFELPEDAPPIEVYSTESQTAPLSGEPAPETPFKSVKLMATGGNIVEGVSEGTKPGQWKPLEDSAPVEPVAKIGSVVILKSGSPQLTVVNMLDREGLLVAVGFVEKDDGSLERFEVTAHPDAFLVVESITAAFSESEGPSQSEKNRKNLS